MNYYRIVYFASVASLIMLLYIEPYTHGGNADASKMLTLTLMVWTPLSILSLFLMIAARRLRTGVIIGWITIVMLLARAIVSGDPRFEFLPLSYTLIFMSSAYVAEKVAISYRTYLRLLFAFLLVAFGASAYACALSFGLYGNLPHLTLGSQRFAFVYDANAALVSVLLSMAFFVSAPSGALRAFALATHVLAMLRLLSFASKGTLVAGGLITAVLLALYLPSRRRSATMALLVCALPLGFYAASSVPLIAKYAAILEGRFGDDLTWHARLSEAQNDFSAFLEEPLLGWGRAVPGRNILGETSSGHITITALLARFGFLGAVGLLIYYTGFFWHQERRVRGLRGSLLLRALITGMYMLVAFLFVMGNPLLLFPAWAFLPALFPRIAQERNEGVVTRRSLSWPRKPTILGKVPEASAAWRIQSNADERSRWPP